METPAELILEPMLPATVRRRQLLPWWIKAFCLLFMFFGPVAFLGLIAAAFGVRFELALYGFETMDALSPIGLLITSQFILKSIVSYELWNEKRWAIKVAILDAFISIGVCTFSMVWQPLMGYSLSLRLELVILVPYVLKLLKIQDQWLGSAEPSGPLTNPANYTA